MLEYLGKQSSEKPFEVNKCVAYLLLNRLTGLAQSIKTLVLKGYYYEASILERSFWEAIGLCSYLSSNIPEAEKWFNGEWIDIPKNKLPEQFAKMIKFNLAQDTSKIVYNILCSFVHSNSPAILSLASISDCSQVDVKRISVAVPSKFNRKIVKDLPIYPTAIALIGVKIFGG